MDMFYDPTGIDVDISLLHNGNLILGVQFIDVSPVPEPATMMLIGADLTGLAGLSRRKKK